MLSCISYFYMMNISPLLAKPFANIFSHSLGCLFILSVVSFAVQKRLKSEQLLRCKRQICQ